MDIPSIRFRYFEKLKLFHDYLSSDSIFEKTKKEYWKHEKIVLLWAYSDKHLHLFTSFRNSRIFSIYGIDHTTRPVTIDPHNELGEILESSQWTDLINDLAATPAKVNYIMGNLVTKGFASTDEAPRGYPEKIQITPKGLLLGEILYEYYRSSKFLDKNFRRYRLGIFTLKTLIVSSILTLFLVFLNQLIELLPPLKNTPAETTIEIPAPISSDSKEGLYSIKDVVDGDTLKVERGGEVTTIRLIGLDTPETVDPRKPVQCFGKEASDKAKELLTGKQVRLEADSTQGERDKYDRLLRYLYLEDGTFFNKWMIEEGYAHEYTYDSNPYKYQSEFMEAQRLAKEKGRGFWSPTTCGGDTTKSASPEAKIAPQTSPVSQIVVPTPESKKEEKWTCNCAKTCSNMSSCSEAQYQLNECGCSARDADDDGVACDANCP